MLELKLGNKQDRRALQYRCYLDDTFRDKAFCHMITIQAATILALCNAKTGSVLLVKVSDSKWNCNSLDNIWKIHRRYKDIIHKQIKSNSWEYINKYKQIKSNHSIHVFFFKYLLRSSNLIYNQICFKALTASHCLSRYPGSRLIIILPCSINITLIKSNRPHQESTRIKEQFEKLQLIQM